MEGCMEVVAPSNHKFSGVIIGNLKFGAFFEVLYPLSVVDSLRTLKVHHCLSMVTIGCP